MFRRRIRQVDGILDGKPVDIGAEFIHGPDTELACLAKALHVPLRALFTWSQGDGGPSETRAPDGGVGYYYIKDEKSLRRFDEVERDITVMHDLLKSLAEQEKKIETLCSMREYLQQHGTTERALTLAESGVGNTAGDPLHEISANIYSCFDRCWLHDSESSDTDYRPEASFRPLIENMAQGVNIMLNAVVRKLAVCDSEDQGSARQIVVSTNNDTFCANQVIVTVPLSVLQEGDIEFEPALSDKKQEAINSVRFSNALKIHLRFHRRCWPKDCHGAVCAGCFVPELWMTNNLAGPDGVGFIVDDPMSKDSNSIRCFDYLGNDKLDETSDKVEHMEQHLVTGFIMGAAADEIAKLPEEQAVSKFLDQLEEMFEEDVRKYFDQGWIHNWKDHKFVRGAYTSPSLQEERFNENSSLSRPGSAARQMISDPHEEKIFFAGEATAGANELTDAPMTVHGAMRTGMRAGLQALGRSSNHKYTVLK